MKCASQKPAVLVVEDETLQALTLESVLQNSGYEVVGPTGDLDEALRLIRTHRIDAAILDIRLSKNAVVYPAARALQQRHITFVFTTAYDPAAPKDFGFTEMTLQKPLKRSVIEKVVRSIAQPAR